VSGGGHTDRARPAGPEPEDIDAPTASNTAWRWSPSVTERRPWRAPRPNDEPRGLRPRNPGRMRRPAWAAVGPRDSGQSRCFTDNRTGSLAAIIGGDGAAGPYMACKGSGVQIPSAPPGTTHRQHSRSGPSVSRLSADHAMWRLQHSERRPDRALWCSQDTVAADARHAEPEPQPALGSFLKQADRRRSRSVGGSGVTGLRVGGRARRWRTRGAAAA
jgi:hypothetical protein